MKFAVRGRQIEPPEKNFKKSSLIRAKLLFIKVKRLINANKICSLLRNGSRATTWVRCDMPSLNVSFILL